eukprot:CAMPEP_0198146902 /NCGR_PEP_ID=MMETSP1443-20131203/32194_1 /TAXON_ID=186043 /ORGANISM="Entomoneis sp., Strain CCMP2396" /LENGTH=202 /DNA_ID=CAMNT_0043811009 /DNA_START=158 /DNA_END=763 /DNA_ORIENTATION=+
MAKMNRSGRKVQIEESSPSTASRKSVRGLFRSECDGLLPEESVTCNSSVGSFSSSSPTCVLSSVEIKAEHILSEIYETLMELKQKEEQIAHSLDVHIDRAVARYLSGNEVGAIVSVKKPYRLQQEWQRLVSTKKTLETMERKLEIQLGEYRTFQEEFGDSTYESSSSLGTLTKDLMDLSYFSGYAQKIQKRLEKPIRSVPSS